MEERRNVEIKVEQTETPSIEVRMLLSFPKSEEDLETNESSNLFAYLRNFEHDFPFVYKGETVKLKINAELISDISK